MAFNYYTQVPKNTQSILTVKISKSKEFMYHGQSLAVVPLPLWLRPGLTQQPC